MEKKKKKKLAGKFSNHEVQAPKDPMLPPGPILCWKMPSMYTSLRNLTFLKNQLAKLLKENLAIPQST